MPKTAQIKRDRSFLYGYVGRKQKKRWFRRYLRKNVNLNLRLYGTNYSQSLSKLRNQSIALNIPMLYKLSIFEPKSY